MELLLTGKQMSDADRYTSESIGIPALVLMERAALSLKDEIQKIDPHSLREIIILCGRGNNGADGLALARLLKESGRNASAVIMPGMIRNDSSTAVQLRILSALSIPVLEWGSKNWIKLSEHALMSPQNIILVDALSGTGLTGDLRGVFKDAASYCNQMHDLGSYVVSVDLPSGVDSDNGKTSKTAVYADETVTFGFRKMGCILFPGALHGGRIILKEIGIPEYAAKSILTEVSADECFFTLSGTDISLLPVRSADGNKGTFGKVLILAGSRGMAGAAILCAEAALRSGAGMVKIISSESNRMILQERLPEAMITTYPDEAPEKAASEIESSVQWADTFAAGPGLGTGEASLAVLTCFIEAVLSLKTHPPLILDADALKLIAKNGDLMNQLSLNKDSVHIILTPHPGEFAVLTGLSIAESKENRLIEGRRISDLLNAVIVLKDARTMVIGPDDSTRTLPNGVFVNCLGNDGMATAGSGDVLTGIISAMSCRVQNSFDAAAMGVLLHAAAGDLAASMKGKEGMTAVDIAGLVGAAIRDSKQ